MSSDKEKTASKPGLQLSVLVKSAIKNLDERGGSSQPAIKKKITEQNKDLAEGESIFLQRRAQLSQW